MGMTTIPQKMCTMLRTIWWWLRQVSGDADYENYLQRMTGDTCAPISAEEFYLQGLRRKHSRINRCC